MQGYTEPSVSAVILASVIDGVRRPAGPATAIAMCQIKAAFDVPPMSACGYKRTFWAPATMSAFGGKADIPHNTGHVRQHVRVCPSCPQRTAPRNGSHPRPRPPGEPPDHPEPDHGAIYMSVRLHERLPSYVCICKLTFGSNLPMGAGQMYRRN